VLDNFKLAILITFKLALTLEAAGAAFYADERAIREAITERRSFNLIHLATMFKVDVFVSRRRPFDREQMKRRARQVVVRDPERALYVASAEDVILAKLEWYKLGGGVSERQWRDVRGVIQIQGRRLEREYLDRWASTLGVADLLERALAEGGAGGSR